MWRSLLTASVAVALVSSNAQAQATLWSQLPDNANGWNISSSGYSSDSMVARNDFTLSSAAFLGTVKFWSFDGGGAGTSVDWQIFRDDGGGKGLLMGGGTSAPLSATSLGFQYYSFDAYLNAFDAGGLSLDAGTYWLELFNVPTGGYHYWVTSSPVVGSQAKFYSTIDGEQSVTDLAFELYSSSVVPEPSTYALMAAGLGLIGVLRRRRKS